MRSRAPRQVGAVADLQIGLGADPRILIGRGEAEYERIATLNALATQLTIGRRESRFSAPTAASARATSTINRSICSACRTTSAARSS